MGNSLFKKVDVIAEREAITNVGGVKSQANVALKTDKVTNTYSLDGSGITIGVISDSYNNDDSTDDIELGTKAKDDILSGDLPGFGNPFGHTTPVKVLSDVDKGKDEGRAMMQLIHDVAPGAKLAFHTGTVSQEDFAQGILDLAYAGADVIVDDVIYYDEPMFQDGIIAQAIDRVVNKGVAYFSAAGNSGRQAYESAFKTSGVFQDGNGSEFHDFDPGTGVDTLQRITVTEGSEIVLSFQWDSPYFSVSGNKGSTNDLDIYLYDRTGKKILAHSDDSNIGGNPVEILKFTNDGSYNSQSFNLAITHFAGAKPKLMKYVAFGDIQINEYDTKSGTVFGHANAAGAETVGAAFYRHTPQYGVSSPKIQSSSSAGSTPILFNTNGTRKATPEWRNNPDIVAPDGLNTTFFYPYNDFEMDGLPNFYGTSAAAPNAAAVAALLLQSEGGKRSRNPHEIYNALEHTAIDMDDPATDGFDQGFDQGTGHGLIDANAAIMSLNPTPLMSINNVSVKEGNKGSKVAKFTVSLSNASDENVKVKYNTASGTATDDYIITQGLLNFAPGETTKNISVEVMGDKKFENNENFFLNLSKATNANIAKSEGEALLNNDDSAPKIFINDISLNEGNTGIKTAQLTVRLSNSNSQPITIKYATKDGTALAVSDYHSKTGTLTFAPGETEKTININLIGEQIEEGNESLFVQLSNAKNASFSDFQGKVSIKNDDSVFSKPPAISAHWENIDTLTGTKSRDTFILGNAQKSLYDNYGSKDYAKIIGFNLGTDSIRLHGTADDYRLKTNPQGLPTGVGIFEKDAHDLMAIVLGVPHLSLDASYFSFV